MKNYKKSVMGMFGVMLAAALVVSACSKKPVQSSPETVTSEPVSITYYLWDEPTYHVIIDLFNASQNEIFVNAQYLPNADYETKITTLLTGRTEMDGYMQKRQADMFPHFNNGFIEPLDAYLSNPGVDHSGIDAYRNALTVDGKVLGFPYRGAGYFTYYNKKIFENAGVPTPDTYVNNGTWTWEKFAEVAQQIASGDGEVYGASAYFWGSSQMMEAAQSQQHLISDAGSVNYNDGVQRFLSMRKKLEDKKAMWPLIDMKVTKTHYSKQFYDGKVGMLLIGEWFPGQMVTGRDQNLLQGFGWEDWGITRIPCDVSPYVTMGAPTFNHVVSYSKKKDATFKFIAWMGGVDGAKIVAKNGILPATVSAEVKAVLSESVPDAQSLDFFTENKISFPIGMNKYGSRIESFVERSIIDDYLLGKLSDDKFESTFKAGLQEIIDTTD
jgi:multiple sugar transport system substrate-binding protein